MHKIKEMLHHDDSSKTEEKKEEKSKYEDSGDHDKLHSSSKHSDDFKKDDSNLVRHSKEEHSSKERLSGGEIKKKKEKKEKKVYEGDDKDLHHHHKQHESYSEEHMHSGKHHRQYVAGEDPTHNRSIEATEITKHGASKKHVHEGEVVNKTVKEVELTKVQPVVHREREQVEIRHVMQPVEKYDVKDTKHIAKERNIDLGTREVDSTVVTSRDIGAGAAVSAHKMESSKTVLGTERQHQELPARVEEHVHKRVEEHIHPVVYKEVLKPKIVEETHHIYEKVKERPVETYEVRDVIHHDRGNRVNEREFFEQASREGIQKHEIKHKHEQTIAQTQAAPIVHKDKSQKLEEREIKEKKHKNKDKSLKQHKSVSVQKQEIRHVEQPIIAQPVMGAHHGNIASHHMAAAAISSSHSSAYDAALCDQCNPSANPISKAEEKEIKKERKESHKQHQVI